MSNTVSFAIEDSKIVVVNIIPSRYYFEKFHQLADDSLIHFVTLRNPGMISKHQMSRLRKPL